MFEFRTILTWFLPLLPVILYCFKIQPLLHELCFCFFVIDWNADVADKDLREEV